MRIYVDYFDSSNEVDIISDSYPSVQFANGAYIEVKARKIVKGEVEVDVGCGNAFGGKNEEEEEGGAANSEVEKVVDVVDAFGLQETSFDKKDWQKAYKSFHDRIVNDKIAKGAKEAEIEAFKADAKVYAKFINSNFAELSVYTPKNYDSENTLVFSYYKNEEDEAPTFIYFLGGMKSYKV
jgi:hypothetical protein